MNRHLLLVILLILSCSASAQKTEILYLSGIDKDNTVDWDFYCTYGNNSGMWSSIPVPSNWELQGFGSYNFGDVNVRADEKGFYRYDFIVPQEWKKKHVNIVFEGSMTDTEVKINGVPAGPVHQGGFYRFSYDVSRLLKYGDYNLLEVVVSKESSAASINRAERMADYWVFGGIYRPVYLEASPLQYIEKVSVDAGADGSFLMEVNVKGKGRAKYISMQIRELSGEPVGENIIRKLRPGGTSVIECAISNIKAWNPESPYLYYADLSIGTKKKKMHSVIQRFGFRTVEFKHSDGIYINGVKILLKGVNRRTFWPSSGRTSSKQIAIEEVSLMKDMNMNAVRLSNIPADGFFMDVCDSLGLFVIDEVAGWQKSYDTPEAERLVKQLVERDMNHPSVILWANGSDGGHNESARDDFSFYDIQHRPVIEPGSIYNGINAPLFPGFFNIEDALAGDENIYLPAGLLNSLNDGGGGAGLSDQWKLIVSDSKGAGAFLWSFADEGIERRDMNDSIDTYGNHGAEGILGPYHEKEASFYAIKNIWSPVQIPEDSIPKGFTGKMRIENNYHFTDLKSCLFSYTLARFSFPAGVSGELTGEIESPQIAPGEHGYLSVNLPDEWRNYDVLYVNAHDLYGRNINTWSWQISSAETFANRYVVPSAESIRVNDQGKMLVIKSGQTEISFDKRNGSLAGVVNSYRTVSFSSNTLFAGLKNEFLRMRHFSREDGHVVEIRYKNGATALWTILRGGILKLDYNFTLKGLYDFAGVTFSYPEELVTGVIMYSDGPYRVWKNRMDGTISGFHEKKFNNTVTGQSWTYPEFKGYYSGFNAIEIRTLEVPITIISATDDLFLHLFTPDVAENLNDVKGELNPSFPEGNISILHCIPSIGTKYSSPGKEGPQGLNTEINGAVEGTLYFRFGE